MNTKLTVKKIADTNWMPVMYSVVEMTVGTSAANTQCVIATVNVGWDTEDNFINWKYDRNVEGMQGVQGQLEVVALSTLEQYRHMTPSTPSRVIE